MEKKRVHSFSYFIEDFKSKHLILFFGIYENFIQTGNWDGFEEALHQIKPEPGLKTFGKNPPLSLAVLPNVSESEKQPPWRLRR